MIPCRAVASAAPDCRRRVVVQPRRDAAAARAGVGVRGVVVPARAKAVLLVSPGWEKLHAASVPGHVDLLAQQGRLVFRPQAERKATGICT